MPSGRVAVRCQRRVGLNTELLIGRVAVRCQRRVGLNTGLLISRVAVRCQRRVGFTTALLIGRSQAYGTGDLAVVNSSSGSKLWR